MTPSRPAEGTAQDLTLLKWVVDAMAEAYPQLFPNAHDTNDRVRAAPEALARVAARLDTQERRVQAVIDLPPVVFAADPKEREMLSKDVVVRVLTGKDASPS